ncbi:hypothetical protein V500_05077 [Pseudogymnoascus sp. VKM F-4518 (FW-2643)]|nr:hypothetical protein V500_05077 [Pseudogymnoascus sp. VKM F-4518 (FW-2643)]
MVIPATTPVPSFPKNRRRMRRGARKRHALSRKVDPREEYREGASLAYDASFLPLSATFPGAQPQSLERSWLAWMAHEVRREEEDEQCRLFGGDADDDFCSCRYMHTSTPITSLSLHHTHPLTPLHHLSTPPPILHSTTMSVSMGTQDKGDELIQAQALRALGILYDSIRDDESEAPAPASGVFTAGNEANNKDGDNNFPPLPPRLQSALSRPPHKTTKTKRHNSRHTPLTIPTPPLLSSCLLDDSDILRLTTLRSPEPVEQTRQSLPAPASFPTQFPVPLRIPVTADTKDNTVAPTTAKPTDPSWTLIPQDPDWVLLDDDS